MIKLSKKDLINLAQELNASKLVGNVYDYEELIYSIRASNFDKDTVAYKVLNEYINKNKESKDCIKKIYLYKNHDKNYHIYTNKIAYSCGIYGNTGQLHQIEIYYDKDIVEILYVYY